MGKVSIDQTLPVDFSEGTSLAGATCNIYNINSDVRAPIYKDPGLTRMIENPVRADETGRFGLHYLVNGEYRFDFVGTNGKLIFSRNGVSVRNPENLGYANAYASVSALLGDDVLSYDDLSGRAWVVPGDHVLVSGLSYVYMVADRNDARAHLETAGGVKFYVQPNTDGSYAAAAFGVKSDGVTDDTAAVQRAVDAIDDGSILIFPDFSTTRISGSITVNKEIEIRGQHVRRTIIQCEEGAYTAFDFSTLSPQSGAFLTLRDIRVEGTVYSGSQLTLFNFSNNSPYVYIENCDFKGGTTHIRLGDTYICKILHSHFSSADRYIYAVNEGPQADLQIRGNTFGTSTLTTSPALDLQFTGTIVEGNYFELQNHVKPCVVFRSATQHAILANNLYKADNGLMVEVDTDVLATITGNVAQNTYDQTTGRAIRINGGAEAVISGNAIQLASEFADGVGLSCSGAAIVTGNRFKNCKKEGINLARGSCVGNGISGCGKGLVLNQATDLVASSNVFTNNTTDIHLQNGDPLVTFNRLATVTDGAANAGLFGNAPWSPAVDENFGSLAATPPSLAAGASHSVTMTVSGAVLGDYAQAAYGAALQGVVLTAWVSASNTVTVQFRNPTSGTIALAAATLKVITRKS